PVTAKDFVLTWEIGSHPDTAVPAFEFYERLEEVEPLDDRRVVLRFDRVSYDYNSVGAFFPLPDHIERARFEADPAGYRAASAYTLAPETPGLWNGPFAVASARSGAQYGFAPNPHWPGPPPGLQSVEVRVIENSAALESNLLSGAVDMLSGEIGLRADQASALEARVGDRYAFRFTPSLFYEHLDLNHDHPALGDARVRRALSLAIDREALSEQLFGGQATPAGAFMASVDPMAIPDPAPAYDPDAAAALLDDAGWTLGAGGQRRNADGVELVVPIVTTSGDQVRATVQQAIQAWWRGIGVNAPIVTEPPRVLFGDTLRQRAFDGAAMVAWISAPEHLPKSTLHSTQIPSEENNFGGQNYMGWAN
ncbi:MAG: ABC transporter substrate-binding protein, partial [Pseudomonadota bacterium]